LVDLILLHPPTIYNFREKTVVLGPISDVVPSSPILESYPIGFLSILSFLTKHGYKIKILNVALKMLLNKNFNLQKTLKSLKPLAFGIDLHWLPHVEGSLKLAKVIKSIHPDKPIIFGGMSATYYHLELINYPYVDYVLRGDTVEEPLLKLIECLEKKQQPENIPNLTWKINGKIKVNPLSFVPENLDDYMVDYGLVIKAAAKDLDPTAYLPYKDWFKYPMAAVLPLKGCPYNCITCGGSNFTYKNICNRTKTALKKPETLVEEIKIISEYIKGAIFILNDLRICGEKYVKKLFANLKNEKIDNPLVFELFKPANKKFLENLLKISPNASVEISPESHDEEIRKSFGRMYGNFELEKTLNFLCQLGFERVDVFFMIGLPQQNQASIVDTIHYMEKLFNLFKNKKTVYHPFIAPLAPFLDPGSLVFENPKVYGYKLFYKTLQEHFEALEMLSWKYFLNYETKWMSRDEIVKTTYMAANLINKVKLKHGLIDKDEAEVMFEKLKIAEKTTLKIDEILKNFKGEELEINLKKLKDEVEKAYEGLLCSKKELLTWPSRKGLDVRLKILGALTKNYLKTFFRF